MRLLQRPTADWDWPVQVALTRREVAYIRQALCDADPDAYDPEDFGFGSRDDFETFDADLHADFLSLDASL